MSDGALDGMTDGTPHGTLHGIPDGNPHATLDAMPALIHGIGVDLVDIPAFRRQLQDPASRFIDGVFTPGERLAAHARPSADPARHLAARYAAKEAFIKAWSAGRFGHPPLTATLDLRHIEVITDHWHRPALRLADPLATLVGPCRLHLSLSHDGDTATAYVVMEAPPAAA